MKRKSQWMYIFMLATSFGAVFVEGGASRRGNAAVVSAGDIQAKGKGDAYWASHFSQCGDSFYTVQSEAGSEVKKLVEVKKVVRHVAASRLSEADRLNGIEWAGESSFYGAAWRTLQDGNWGAWYETPPATVEMLKQNGTWTTGRTSLVANLTPIACDEAIAIATKANTHLVRNCKITALSDDLTMACRGEMRKSTRGVWIEGDIYLIVNQGTKFSGSITQFMQLFKGEVRKGDVVSAECHAEILKERDVMSHCIADKIEVNGPPPK